MKTKNTGNGNKTRLNAIKPHKNSTACHSFSFLEFCHLIIINDVKRRLKKIFHSFFWSKILHAVQDVFSRFVIFEI